MSEIDSRYVIGLEKEIKELKEYKAEVERLAKDDTLWHSVEKLDKLKESLKYMTKDFNSEHAYVSRLLKHQKILEARNLLDKDKLEKIDKQLLLKMNSTPSNFEESAVKVFAHYIYELSTGKTLSEQLKESLESK